MMLFSNIARIGSWDVARGAKRLLTVVVSPQDAAETPVAKGRSRQEQAAIILLSAGSLFFWNRSRLSYS
jgi:hypothetical protein